MKTALFYGLDFEVTSDVLSPYKETELLVSAVLEVCGTSPRICDLGTGSGNIGVAVLASSLQATCVATDVSEQALMVAKRNAERYGVASRFDTILSDGFENISGRFDVIVCNPNYWTPEAADTIGKLAKPRIAFTDDQDGFSMYRAIIPLAPSFLKAGGYLILECSNLSIVSSMFDTQWTLEWFEAGNSPHCIRAKLNI